MIRSLMLALATVAIIGVCFAVYLMGQRDPAPATPTQPSRFVDRPHVPLTPTTQPSNARSIQGEGFSFRGTNLPPGENPAITIFDPKGNERILFRSARWEPVSDTEFHVSDLDARIQLPGGQLVYVKADEANIVVQRTDSGNYNPKSGSLHGRVYIIIDRTSPEWRKANPTLAEPDQHPDQVVKLWLDDLAFDLDLAKMESDGPIVLQSADGSLRGRGLELVWNEVDRRIMRLRIVEGERAVLRGRQMADLGLSAGEEAEAPEAEAGETVADATPTIEPTPNQAVAIDDSESASSLTFVELDKDRQEIPDELRVDSYEIQFQGGVKIEQRDGIRLAGALEADVLRLIADLGENERDAVEHAPSTQPADGAADPNEPMQRPPVESAFATGDGSYLDLRWGGELLVEPAAAPETPLSPGDPKRFHVIAEGKPVHIRDDRTGDAVCHQLEYHHETKQVWLRGTASEPVVTNAGENRQLIGEVVFVDRNKGIARVDGAGRMVAGPKDANPRASESEAGLSLAEASEITWTDWVEIHFGQATVDVTHPQTGEVTQERKEYLTKAVFEGGVAMLQDRQSIRADRIEADFEEPTTAEQASFDSPTMPKTITAIGSVALTSGKESVVCDRLEAEMAVDDTGRPYPKIGRATGNVIARQGGSEIRAEDSLVITASSVPMAVTDEQRATYEAAAKQRGIKPGSAEWNRIEQKLASRRDVVIRTLNATGQVQVRDRENEMAMEAETLDCTFADNREIKNAVIARTEENPARVETADFVVRGPQVLIDTATQAVDVPGAGTLRFFAAQDLNGEPVDEPMPITVKWDQRMALRGHDNVAMFTGEVHSESETMTLDCKELRIDFKDLPKPPSQAVADAGVDKPDPRWIFGPMVDAMKQTGRDESPMTRTADRLRKRPAYLHAIGEAVIESRSFEIKPEHAPSRVVQALTGWLPAPLQGGAEAKPKRLLSRLRIAGPKIGIDLIQEHVGVEGKGNLLIEDYRLPRGNASAQRSAEELLQSAQMGALASGGPGQTLFTWQSSLLFLNNRQLARFDNQVTMRHASGAKMVLSKREAEAMNFDLTALSKMRGREVSMSCDNLMVTFEPQEQTDQQGRSPLARSTRLRTLQAVGQIVRMQEGDRSAEGTRLTFDNDSSIVRLTGSARVPARFMEWDEVSNKMRFSRNEVVEWNQKTGLVRAFGTSVLATR